VFFYFYSMIKILSADQIRSWDKATIENEPISSIELMERASRSFVSWFTEKFTALNKVGIICGTGNNGGDGLALARFLKDWGYPVKVWIVRGTAAESEDFKSNLARAIDKVEIIQLSDKSDQRLFNDRDVLIDAIFGYGLSRTAEGIYAKVIDCINAADCIRVAIDIPSGLAADKASHGAIVRADYTVSFQSPKLAFFFPTSYPYTGEWLTVDIGLDKKYCRQAETKYFVVNKKGVKRLLRPRSRFDHKGTFGHALLVAGSYGKMGAAVLSGSAIKRSGAGLLTICSPRCGYPILQTAVPEAMVVTDPSEEFLSQAPDVSKADVIGIGPGLGQRLETMNAVRKIMEEFRKPMVFDADALNILAAHRDLYALVPEGSILTPHPKEFERLAGKWVDDFERLEMQKRLAKDLKSAVVLKGGYTSIATADGLVYFNPTGNPGMATGGTGDVLTGILTGLLAQGYPATDAAVLGVYLHGLAGDLGVLETGLEGLIASDIVKFLPAAFRQVGR
jgi:ADP-dependent NAD(P)H-hydrate dehydratase / NAD(P)H-hydrate epimerase